MSTNVKIHDVKKMYGSFTAIERLSLDIKEGEFFTLLGPSGCGKTTLLRMIAGFNSIESGEIFFNEQRINDVPAHKRDIGMVFQNYAIFPHMSVYDNVAYGLKTRNVGKQERDQRIMEALRTVQIETLKDRMPSALSGGQQQRVALARAIVIRPTILLMDEPLSNLDAKLRVQMRSVIKKLQRELNITTVYVTHDQEEALAISDRIAVLERGYLRQLGKPEDIYNHPNNAFVANFIGTSNFIRGDLVNGQLTILGQVVPVNLQPYPDGEVMVAARPELIEIQDAHQPGIAGTIELSTFLGDFINYEIRLENGQLIQVNEYPRGIKVPRSEKHVTLRFDAEALTVFSHNGEERLNAKEA